MKTLISAIALTLAASAPAFAGDSVASDAGIALALQDGGSYSAVQVSGFTGVGEFSPAMDTAREGGKALVLQNDANIDTFGFRGIQEAPSYTIVHNDPVR